MYISDLIGGLVELMLSDYIGGPMNFGKEEEYNMVEITEIVTRAVQRVQGGKFRPTKANFLPATKDDPLMRNPDCALAKEQLGWSAKMDIDEGMLETVEWFAAMEEEDWLYDMEEDGKREAEEKEE
jgi:nucleoside-diphosphate-sugar epimerase